MHQFIFGPVPSRRLGMSLGIDLVPRKVCSLDCVYCEVGTTTKLTTQRMEYVPYNKVIKELEEFLEHHVPPDFITFSGYGEPMLNSRAGDVLQYIKTHYPLLQVAVLTNGTLLHDPQVRKELMQADLVLPSLDAATENTFRKLNRPAEDMDVKRHIKGLADFKKEFQGEMWLEIFILPGYNDNNRDVEELRKAIETIRPDRVQLNTLDRPGAIQGIRPATEGELNAIKEKLKFPGAEVVASSATRKTSTAYRSDTEQAILETIARRPCTLQDMREILGLHTNEINKYLDVMEADGKIITEIGERGTFYRVRY
ncbi:MAG: radical SAM protein [Marinilabiliaceae bacterium]